MFKFRFMAYMIGTVVLVSSFDVQKCADSLNAAYDAKDYDAYVDAFPDKYEDFVKVYGYDHKNGVKTILYDCSYEHIDFLFSSERVVEQKVLDKLLSLSYGYIWDADAVKYVIMGVKRILFDYPQRMTEYFAGKTDDEVISFLQMALTCLYSDNEYYLEGCRKLVETYTPYSNRIVRLLKVAQEKAKEASEVLVIY